MSKQSKSHVVLTWIYQSLLIFPPDLLIARGLSSPRSPHGLAWLPLLIANSRHTPPVSTYDYNISPPALFIVWRSPPTITTTTTIFLHLQYLLCGDLHLRLRLQYFSDCNIYCVWIFTSHYNISCNISMCRTPPTTTTRQNPPSSPAM